MMKRIFLLVIMTMMMMATNSFRNEKSDDTKTSFVSYYHDKFNGRKTSSGEIFDNAKLTAANKTLPFGTKVKLINLKNGKSVVVTINDRGPFTKKREFDITKAAFKEIGDVRAGVMAISYEVEE